MKRILFIFAAIAFAASCASEPQYANRAEKILAEMHDPTSDYVIVASHRGDWRNYPENSIPAIESVIRMGVDIVEIDLKMTKDSVLVLSHDKTIDRMLNGKGLVSDFTLDSLRTFRLKRAHNVTTDSLRITTLEEALTVCKDRIVVNLDHAWDYYDAAIAVAEKVGVVDQILMKGKKPLKVVEDKLSTHENNFMYMPIIDINKPAGQKLFAEYKELGVGTQLAYEVCWNKMTPEVENCMKDIIAGGSKVWANSIWGSLCGYLDDDAAYEFGPENYYGKLVDMGVTMIQTDRPEFIIEYLRSRGLHD
jgi:glycerophosphoryl diester phosphodiesterase